MAEPCPQCLVLQKRVAELEAQVASLQAQVVELKQLLELALRASKRQAAPFAKEQLKQRPKKPGRKSGEQHGQHGQRPPPPPEHIDETFEAPLPESCPDCDGPIDETHVDQQYQTEIPRQPICRQFNIHCGQCRRCHKQVRGRHPLQTSNATGAAASQLGPDAQAAIVVLNKDSGMSHGKISRVFKTLFGIRITPGAVTQIILRAGKKLLPAYEEIKRHLQEAKYITPDETGWRVGGRPAWLHVGVADDGATCYVIDPGRSACVLENIIGPGYAGTLIHDGLPTYDRFEQAEHQQCQAHALRRAHDMTVSARGRARDFPEQVIELMQEALALRDDVAAGDLPASALDGAYEEFADRLLDLSARPRSNKANATFAKHLGNHGPQWFTFLFDPNVPATNYQAEQALRGPIVNRKVWGGNRTESGARAQESTSSVIQTCKNRTLSALDYINTTLRGFVVSLFTPRQTA
jgi:transposase